jgi:uncharacterized protein (TIGR02246 family)
MPSTIATTPLTPPGNGDLEPVLRLLESGWNDRDARRFASAFTERHDYIAVGGRLTLEQDRALNAAVHDRIWKELYSEGCTIHLKLLKAQRLSDDLCVAVIENREDLISNGNSTTRASFITAVLVKEQGAWRIAHFNNNAVAVGDQPP